MAERLVRYLAVEEALQEEMKHTLEHNNKSYGDWCAISYKDKNKNKVKLTVTYDMGWQKRSSGRIYDSSSGQAFIIGASSKGITGMVLYSKACRMCDYAENIENKQKNMSTQITPRESQKVWRLLLY